MEIFSNALAAKLDNYVQEFSRELTGKEFVVFGDKTTVKAVISFNRRFSDFTVDFENGKRVIINLSMLTGIVFTEDPEAEAIVNKYRNIIDGMAKELDADFEASVNEGMRQLKEKEKAERKRIAELKKNFLKNHAKVDDADEASE